jgi:hypothetical protein
MRQVAQVERERERGRGRPPPRYYPFPLAALAFCISARGSMLNWPGFPAWELGVLGLPFGRLLWLGVAS